MMAYEEAREFSVSPGTAFIAGSVFGTLLGIALMAFLPETPEEKVARLNAEQLEWKMELDRNVQELEAIAPYLQYMQR